MNNHPALAPTGRMSAPDWLRLVALGALWGGSFFLAKVAVTEIPPLTVVLGRVAVAALTLLVVLAVSGQSLPRGRRVWVAFFGMGLLNNLLPFGLIFWGQTQIGAGLASILNATTPLFTVLVAHVLTGDERMSAGKLAGVVLGIAGVAVMLGPRAASGLDGSVLAQLACLAAALSYAFAAVFGRRFRRLGVGPMQTAFGQVTASTVLTLPLTAAVDLPWMLPTPAAGPILAVLALGTACTALAYTIFFRLMASAGATNVSLVTFLVPVSAIVLGITLLGERLSGIEFAGMGLIAVGLVAIDGRVSGRFRARDAGTLPPPGDRRRV